MVIEDHPVFAEGPSLQEDYPDLTVVGRADSVAEVISVAGAVRADVAVIDFSSPTAPELTPPTTSRARSSSTAIVFLTAVDGDEPLLAAIESNTCADDARRR